MTVRYFCAGLEGAMQIDQGPIALVVPTSTRVETIGNEVEIFVTVTNQGSQSALIDVYIDESSQPLYAWFSASREQLALGPDQSAEASFRLKVPVQAAPGTYNYTIIVDAPQHYPEDTPISRTLQLQLLPRIGPLDRQTDPTFTLDPPSAETRPLVCRPGQPLLVQVNVHNRSERTDRYRLTCPDLEDDWFGVRYSPSGQARPGLVGTGGGLELNPGERGQILLTLHPPANSLTGSYSPTVQVFSANNPNVQLIDLVYLEIPPIYDLKVELRTLRGKVTHSHGQYELQLVNMGNAVRVLTLSVTGSDEEELCLYKLDPQQVRLLPGKSQNIALEVRPRYWWRQPLYGRSLDLNFRIGLEDERQLPLPRDMTQATLVWQPRPWWQLLLVFLLVLLILAGIAWVIWRALEPPPGPVLIAFETDSVTYKEGDRIRLNWRVRNPDQLQRLVVTGQGSNGELIGKPVTYNFDQGIPSELVPRCQTVDRVLTCTDVATEARKASRYSFQLQVFGQTGEPVSQTTPPIQIAPKPKPQIAPPKPPRIVQFLINGKEAPPKIQIEINNPLKPVKDLNLRWAAQGSNITVELLPAPGTVGITGSRSYTPSKREGTEILTLKVSNVVGQITRSVTIETYSVPVVPPSAPSTPAATSGTPPPVTKSVRPAPATSSATSNPPPVAKSLRPALATSTPVATGRTPLRDTRSLHPAPAPLFN